MERSFPCSQRLVAGKKKQLFRMFGKIFVFVFARQLIGPESLEVIAFFGSVCVLISDGCIGDYGEDLSDGRSGLNEQSGERTNRLRFNNKSQRS